MSLLRSREEWETFKQQLLEFIEELDHPFDADYLVKNCNKFIDRLVVEEALNELLNDGLIVEVGCKEYASIRILMRRWLIGKQQKRETQRMLDEAVFLPSQLLEKLRRLIKPEWGYKDIEDFIRDAVRHWLKEHEDSP